MCHRLLLAVCLKRDIQLKWDASPSGWKLLVRPLQLSIQWIFFTYASMTDTGISALRSLRARIKIHVILYVCQAFDIIRDIDANYLVSSMIQGCWMRLWFCILLEKEQFRNRRFDIFLYNASRISQKINF